MSKILSNSEIDTIGELLKNDNLAVDSFEKLNIYKASFSNSYQIVIESLKKLDFSVTGRPWKTTKSITDKLIREKSRLSQIQDIAGCRIVVPDIEAQEIAIEQIDIFLGNSKIIDRRELPVEDLNALSKSSQLLFPDKARNIKQAKSSHGYRAVHFIYKHQGRAVEVQLRTELQHKWAEVSEKIADMVNPSIKYGVGDTDLLELLANLSNAIAATEQDELVRHVIRKNHRNMKPSKEKHELNKKMKSAEKKYQSQRKILFQVLIKIRDRFS